MMKHTGTVSLETERLILRRFTLDDAQQAFDNWMSREKVTRYMTWQPYQNVEDVKGYIQYVIGTYEKPDAYYWAIEEKNSGQVIGSISVIWLNEAVESGMRYEGTLRQADRNNQGVCDTVLRAILRNDYNNR